MARNDKSDVQNITGKVKRREVLAGGGALVAASAVTACAPLRQASQVGAQGASETVAAQATAVPSGWNMPFAEPEATYSDDQSKALVADLNVEFADITIEEPDPAGGTMERIETSRTYNGQVPGPTFRAKAGDKLEFKVINKLPPNVPAPPPFDAITDCHHLMSRNVPGCFNTTNLHTHGLHVSPTTKPNPDRQRGVSSDDVHVRIPPYNDTLDDTSWPSERPYCIWLPEFHAPGTHWYHAHVHGSTALQVVNGLAGALIIEEPADQKVDVDEEKILIMQEIIGENAENVYGNIRDPETNLKPYGDGPPSATFTINSLTFPTITMRPNEIQRWRFINATATPRGFMNLALFDDGDAFVDDVLHLIAVDGITFYGKSPQPIADPGHFMSPANRADFLVKFAAPGTYRLMKTPTANAGGGGPGSNEVLVTITVAGDPVDDRPLPSLPSVDKAPCYLNPITDDELINNAHRTFTFHFNPSGGGIFGGHTINDQAYGRLDQDGNPKEAPNTCVPLGDAEEWTLLNTSPAAHPFHIHVNPFQVVGDKIDPDGPDEPSNWRWWDTISIPSGTVDNPGSVTIRSRFLTYHGKFVIHCHILVHEDIGMMQDLTVEGDGYGPCEPVYECKLTAP